MKKTLIAMAAIAAMGAASAEVAMYGKVDLGLTSYIVDSDGNKEDPLKPLKKSLKKLKRLSRNHSKKKKGSKNRKL